MTPGGEGPRRVWYGVGGTLAVVGIAVAIAWVVVGLRGFARQVDDFQRVDVGDEGEVTLSEAGGYTIYYEGPGANDSEADIPEINVAVEGPGVDDSALDDYDTELTYSVGGHEGRAVLTLRVEEPGTYLLRVSSEDDAEGEVAIGPSVGGRLVRSLVGAVVIGLWSVGGAIGIILVTALRRRDARRRPPAAMPT